MFSVPLAGLRFIMVNPFSYSYAQAFLLKRGSISKGHSKKKISHHRMHYRNQVSRKTFLLLIFKEKNMIEMDKYWDIWYQIKAYTDSNAVG